MPCWSFPIHARKKPTNPEKLLVRRLEEAGHRLHEKAIVPDEISRIRTTVSRWSADDDVDAVLATGGTGVTGRDGTPEAVSVLFDKEIEGFGELFRYLSYQEIGTSSLQSRAVAGVANGTYIFLSAGLIGRLRYGLGQHHLAPARLPHPALQPG